MPLGVAQVFVLGCMMEQGGGVHACGVAAQVRGGWSKGVSWGQLARRMLPFLRCGSAPDRCACTAATPHPVVPVMPAPCARHRARGCFAYTVKLLLIYLGSAYASLGQISGRR